jgi:hypothetical protein
VAEPEIANISARMTIAGGKIVHETPNWSDQDGALDSQGAYSSIDPTSFESKPDNICSYRALPALTHCGPRSLFDQLVGLSKQDA